MSRFHLFSLIIIVYPPVHACNPNSYTLIDQIWLLYSILQHNILSLLVQYDMPDGSVALGGVWLPISPNLIGFSTGVELLSESSFPCWDLLTFTGCAASTTSCFALLVDRLMPICTESIGVLVIEHDLTKGITMGIRLPVRAGTTCCKSCFALKKLAFRESM